MDDLYNLIPIKNTVDLTMEFMQTPSSFMIKYKVDNTLNPMWPTNIIPFEEAVLISLLKDKGVFINTNINIYYIKECLCSLIDYIAELFFEHHSHCNLHNKLLFYENVHNLKKCHRLQIFKRNQLSSRIIYMIDLLFKVQIPTVQWLWLFNLILLISPKRPSNKLKSVIRDLNVYLNSNSINKYALLSTAWDNVIKKFINEELEDHTPSRDVLQELVELLRFVYLKYVLKYTTPTDDKRDTLEYIQHKYTTDIKVNVS